MEIEIGQYRKVLMKLDEDDHIKQFFNKMATLFRTKPSLSYCGLTLVLSNQSRFDTARLLTGNAMHVVNDLCLRPEHNIMQCDVRVADDHSPWLPNTKCIMLLGEYALHIHVPKGRINTLNEARGSLYEIAGIPAIASYYPQDCCDFKNYELEHNANSKSVASLDDEEDDEKALGKTARSNYSFWLKSDTRKAKWILKNGRPIIEKSPKYVNYPNSAELIQVLLGTKGQHLYFDMETDYEQQNMQCFSFSFDGELVYNVPILDYTYKVAYSSYAQIMRALAVAIRDNTLVAHNGSTFDFIVLGYKYRIPVVKCYDTMLAMHRCFPSIEKSLGHCTSYWTWQPFHKDQDSRGYRTKDQMMARMAYCGKDVFTMYLIKQAIDKYAKTVIGLEDSIATAQAMILPYLVSTMQGILVDWQLREKKRYENDRLMERYLKMIEICIGEDGLKEMRSVIKGKHASGMPGSNKQCVQYFHNMLGYSVVHYNPPDKHGKRNPSLAALALYKLRLKYENPVIDLCNIYRGVKLETSTPLGFLSWKDDNNKIHYEPNTTS